MKPLLIVEGKELEVYAVYYRESKVHCVSVLNDDNSTTEYHDTKEDVNYYEEKPKQIDFDSCLIWKNKNDDAIKNIENKISAYEERMAELSFDYIRETNPFADNLGSRKEFLELEQKIFGLEKALLILSDDYSGESKTPALDQSLKEKENTKW